LTDYTTPVKIHANYIPTLAEVSATQYESPFIATLAALLNPALQPLAEEVAATPARA
jgi:hypothetical protein